jgi:type IV pilus assembly protein PilO
MTHRSFRFGNLSGSAQALIFAALIAVLVVVFYVLYLRVLLEARERLGTEITRLEAGVVQRRTLESRLGQFEHELTRLDRRLETLGDVLARRNETADVLRSIQRMADETHLEIIKLNPQALVARNFICEWPIILEVEGNYTALRTFCERLRRLNRIIHVDSLTAKAINGSTDPGRTLTAACTIIIFVLKEAIPDPQ